MVDVCFYFQVHQPFRLNKFSVFDIGSDKSYFNKKLNQEIMEKVARKCYLPMNNLLMKNIHDHNFKATFSFSGVVLEQFEKYSPEVLESFQELVDTGNVEVLSETSHHSLAFLYSKQEFDRQVKLHSKKVKKLFGVKPKVFRNTELIFNNALGAHVEKLGYDAILAEGADHILGWRSPNFLYKPKTANIKLMLKNYRLSDDIAFRFSLRSWKEWPLTAEKFAKWVSATNGNGHTVNLFMDYETFGEHQWSSTGIFKFMKAMPSYVLKHPDNRFRTCSEVASSYDPVAELDIHHPVSWADLERDTSAWVGNPMQNTAIRELYRLEKDVMASDEETIEAWRKLQTSDHFYYMCTKWFSDGDVHKYFNPYDNPYDAFIDMMNIINDINMKVGKTEVGKKKKVAVEG